MLTGLSPMQWMWTIHALLGFIALCVVYALVLRTQGSLRRCFWLLFSSLVLYVLIHAFLIFDVFFQGSIDPQFIASILHIFFLLVFLYVLYEFLHLVVSLGKSQKEREKPRSPRKV